MTEESTNFIESKYNFYCRRNFKQKNGTVWNLAEYVQWMIKLMKESNINIIDEDQERKSRYAVKGLKL
jgi:ABC-type proline/glycine betaine transport system substrate-binding protein